MNPLEAHVGYWLRYVSNHVSHAFALKVAEHGVTVAEWVALRELFDSPGMMQTTLADRLGMTRGAISKLTHRLEAKHLAVREGDPHDKGTRLLRLTPAGRALVPVLTELAAELHITAFISVYDEGDVVCLDRVHDMKGIEVHWWAIGGTLPYNCGGAPKLLLAHQSPEEIERVLQREPVALTAKSVVDRDQLRAMFEKIRKRDWECAVDDVTLGLSALAVPVRSPGGRVVCSVSMAGLTPQMVEHGRPVHLKRLQAAAESVERRLRLSGSR